MDESEQLQRQIAETAALLDGLVATARRERDRRRAAGTDTAWLEQLLTELAPLTEQAHDLEKTDALRRTVRRHGPGPYPPEDLAALAGIDDVDALQRVAEQLAAAGLMTPPGDSPE